MQNTIEIQQAPTVQYQAAPNHQQVHQPQYQQIVIQNYPQNTQVLVSKRGRNNIYRNRVSF